MQKFTTFLLLSFVLFVAPQALAQRGIPEKIGADSLRAPSLRALENKAKNSYKEGDYGAAIKYYERILATVDSFHVSALQGLADAAEAYTNYKKAARTYDYMRQNKLVEEDSRFLLKLANIKYLSRNYADARALYQQVDSTASSADYRAAAKIGIQKCDQAIKMQKEALTDITIDNRQVFINTKYAEYSNVWYDQHKQLYYSSYSQPHRGDSSKLLFQIMTAQIKPDGSLRILRMSNLNEPNHHTAYVSFNADTTRVYFAVGDYRKNKRICFKLYRRKLMPDGTWGKAEKLPGHINHPKSSTSQPFVCTLPGESIETLFFVSDRPGGKGKRDIWFCKIENDEFSKPENLNALNTDGEDMSPAYHAPSGVLFFSSTGRNGLGGFDIYRSEQLGQQWTEPQLLPIPFNSPANDLFYSQSEDGNTMFLSSNREGTEQFSDDECCYDIFKYCRPQQVNVTVCHAETRKILHGVNLSLFDTGSDVPMQVSPGSLSDSTLAFSFTPEQPYRIIASKPGFVSDTLDIIAPRDRCDAQRDTICLKPVKVKLDVHVVGCCKSGELKGATVELFRKESGTSVLQETKTAPDQTVYNFNLEGETNYEVQAIWQGISGIDDLFSTAGLLHDTTFVRQVRIRQELCLDVQVYDDVDDSPMTDVVITLLEVKAAGDTVTVKEYTTGPDSHEYQDNWIQDFSQSRTFIVKVEKADPLRKKYNSASAAFRTDTVGNCLVRKELFLRKIPDLPITLFFDNDEPGTHTSLRTIDPRPDIPKRYVTYDVFKRNFARNLDSLFHLDPITRQDTIRALYGRFVDLSNNRLPNIQRDFIGPFWHIVRGDTLGAFVPLQYQDIYLGYVKEAPRVDDYFCHPILGHKCNVNRHHCVDTTFADGKIAVPGYYNLKETFVQRYLAGSSPANRLQDSLHVDAFFEDSVRGEWNRLRDVFESTYAMLEDPKVKQVTIAIRGYASPLGNPAYNRVLTSRRVNSIVQFFWLFDGGIFMEHILSGKLVLKREPNGAAKADATVSANPRNRRQSVYSVEASRERRVEVIGLDVQYNN